MQLPTITTKRRSLAQILICQGCCCGQVARGKPAVPVDWLKQQWRENRLNPTIQLTITGCLGPCDLANVVGILTPKKMIWLGGLTTTAEYDYLQRWAVDCAMAETVVPLPRYFEPLIFHRFESLKPVVNA
jgi:hypothetical protein